MDSNHFYRFKSQYKYVDSDNRYITMLGDGATGGIDLSRHGGHYNHGKKQNKFEYQDTRTDALESLSQSELFQESECQYEGGGGRDENDGPNVKKLFSNSNATGADRTHQVTEELKKHGSKEKTGFMEKEAKFVKNLKEV